jgi:hypothetical protein
MMVNHIFPFTAAPIFRQRRVSAYIDFDACSSGIVEEIYGPGESFERGNK